MKSHIIINRPNLTYWTKRAFELLSEKTGFEVVEYQPYEMYQLSHIYLDRLLSRTPKEYAERITGDLPEVVKIPTNEVIVY